MRLHRIVLAALLAFCARGAFAGSDGDGSWEAHEGAWGGSGTVTRLAHGAAAEAAPTTELIVGRREYEQKCAGCHGISGKGDGVSRPVLVHGPADLTVFARSHGGEFPYDHFYGTVAGRYAENDEMPSYGHIYSEEPIDFRLVALASYVADLQER